MKIGFYIISKNILYLAIMTPVHHGNIVAEINYIILQIQTYFLVDSV